MLVMLMTSLMLIPLLSPIKVAFSVVSISIMVSMASYSACSSIFPSAGIIISFSSGMMILFCYCAMMSSYESKNNKKTMAMIIVGCLFMMCMNLEETKLFSNNMKVTALSTSTLVVVMMSIIMISMVCINMVMFTPTKSMTPSY